ncbi:MAG: pilus assembly protein PilP [Candidatus Magnetomorum sp.]|nr:pilus assembly protein PilP [Candidatus Magnetomorum sp.]
MKKLFDAYIARYSALLLSVFFLLVSCNETQQPLSVQKMPTVIRKKIVFAGQTQPIPVAHAESSKISLTVLENNPEKHENSTAQQHTDTHTDSLPATESVTATAPVLTSDASKKNSVDAEKQAVDTPSNEVQTAKSSPSPITTETDMALVLKKLAPKPFQYRPQGKVDPFVPLIVKKKRMLATSQPDEKPIEKKRTRILTLLEKFDLSQLKLTAIMMTPKRTVAIVEETSGRGFVVKAGTRIGLNSGRVVDILLDRIIIQETEEIITGKKLYITKEMKLNKPDSEF